jgi:hypothetical protein
MPTIYAGISQQLRRVDMTMHRPSLMPIVKALKVDRAIRRNIYAYQLFRTCVLLLLRLGWRSRLERASPLHAAQSAGADGGENARADLKSVPAP